MIVIIGAGPAGLSAAKAVASQNTPVTVLDSQPRAGGQYWRHIDEVSGYQAWRSREYLAELENYSYITFISGAQVWSAGESNGEFVLNYLHEGVEKKLFASKLILATGAYDRTLPFPGWTTPGVMTPGAAQALLKGHGVLAGRKIIVSGSGPFLFPVAMNLSKSGAEVEIIEAQNPLRWGLSPIALILNLDKFAELIHYGKAIIKGKIRISFKCAVTSFDNGVAKISKVHSNLTIRKLNIRSQECEVLATGWGFLPDLSLGGILGCNQILDRDETVIFKVDRAQKSTVTDIWIAGEATGIGGADLALIEGAIAGLSATGGRISLKLKLRRIRKKLFARALQRSYPVSSRWQEWLDEKTVICRCEEVNYHEIVESVEELAAEDARSVKLFTRAGMGLCQGRVCARNINDLIAANPDCSLSPEQRMSASNRPIAAPISLGVLGDGRAR